MSWYRYGYLAIMSLGEVQEETDSRVWMNWTLRPMRLAVGQSALWVAPHGQAKLVQNDKLGALIA